MSLITCTSNCKHQKDGVCFLEQPKEITNTKLKFEQCPYYVSNEKSKEVVFK